MPNPQAVQEKPARILIVDDHPVLRQGISLLLECEKDLAICGEAPDAVTAKKAMRTMNPDLVIIDLSLKEENGLTLVHELHNQYPDLPILVLSMHEEELYAERCIRAGAHGYVMKQVSTEKLLEAIRSVLSGETFLSPRMAAAMAKGRTNRNEDPITSLSDRELEVFRLIGSGLGTREIAVRLKLSIKTVESHREHIKSKLRLKNATELVQQAVLRVYGGQFLS